MTGDLTIDVTERLARLSPAQRARVEHALLASRAGRSGPRFPRRPPGLDAPLSFAQRGMWFLDQWQPGSALYGVRSALRITGPLDVAALRGAFAAVGRRHEVLRTTFVVLDGQPVQRVVPDMDLPIPVVDLRDLPPGDRQAQLDRLRAAEETRPYDLGGGPMVRATLIRCDEREHVLLLSLHHIVADGWSYALLVRDLSAGYAALAAGRDPGLPELPRQYGDYAAWQVEQVDGPAGEERLRWWAERLAGAPPVLALPTDRPRPPVLSYHGATVDFTVAKSVVDGLKELGRGEGATLFMTLLAALQTLLHRYTGETDVTVGSPVAGRADPVLEQLIGCFANTIALRGDLSGDPTFRELLRRVRDVTVATYAHQDVPFEWLVERLRPDRSAGHSPIFQVMLVLENMPEARWQLPGVDVEPLGVADADEAFDLSLSLTDGGDGLAGTLRFSTDLFDASTAAGLARHLEVLLAGVADAPDDRLSELPLLTADERQRILADWSHAGPGGARTQPETLGAGVPIGRPVTGMRAYVLDAALRPVPARVVGELFLSGVQVARGYLNRPALTARQFLPDPFGPPGERMYRTADLVRWSSDGRLEFVGRHDQQVKVRGHRVELGEIEAVLQEHPGAHTVAVVTWSPAPDDVRLVAHVAGTVTAEELLRFAAERLPAHMLPNVVLPAETLPLTPNGKVDRRALRVPPATAEQHTPAADDPVLGLLSGIWCDVLRRDGVGPGTDFFRCGGHSLLAIRVMARIEEALGVRLPVRVLFEEPTLGAFARRVGAARQAGRAETVPPVRALRLEGPAPLSRAQRRLWFSSQLDRGNTSYNICMAFDVDGPLHAGRLDRAVDRLRARHAALRTTFRQVGVEPEQLVHEPEPVATALLDLRGLPASERERTAQRLAQAEAERPFDLGRGPLLRGTLIRLEDERHLLLLSLHHIVTDAWSSELLLEELWQAYTGDITAPPPPVQYTDFAAWERDRLEDGSLRAAEEYWLDRLAGLNPVTDLRGDRPRPARPVFQEATLPFELTPAATRDLLGFCLRTGVTPFMTVLAAYAALVRHRTGEPEVVIGANAANRGRPELERLIGFFTNQLVLRLPVPGTSTVRELLTSVREETVAAYAHQEMPFDRLVELLRPERHVNRAPVFQVEITFHREADDAPPPGLAVRRRELHSGTTNLDLSLHVAQTEHVLRGGLSYNADIFSADTARQLLEQLLALLTAMIEQPDERVHTLVSGVAEATRAASTKQRAAQARALFDRIRTRDGS